MAAAVHVDERERRPVVLALARNDPPAPRRRRRQLVTWVVFGVAGATVAVAFVANSRSRRATIRSFARYATAVARTIGTVLAPSRAPRAVPWMVVKRENSKLGDSYGHWWLELDGAESYGWWPARCPLRLREFLFGTAGVLNGPSGTPARDTHHGDDADHAFHPTLVVRKSDWQIRRDVRRFARSFSGEWRWRVRKPAVNCRSFQLDLLAAAGLVEGEANLYTRGPGCPVLRPVRRARCVRRSHPPLSCRCASVRRHHTRQSPGAGAAQPR